MPDVEMQETELREPRPRGDMNGEHSEGQDGQAMGRTREENKWRRRNFTIGLVFAVVLVVLIIVFAIVVIEANKPGGVAA